MARFISAGSEMSLISTAVMSMSPLLDAGVENLLHLEVDPARLASTSSAPCDR